MTARVLEGRTLATQIRADVTDRAAAFSAAHGRAPCLVAVQVGHDPASTAYAKAKGRAAAKCGLSFRLEQLPADVGTGGVIRMIRQLNDDPAVDGLLIEMPLPQGYDRLSIEAAMDPARDADGVSPINQGRLLAGTPGPRPATALAAIALVGESGVPVKGAEAVVIGRSVVVGKPIALLLLAQHATVTLAHSRTTNLPTVARRADILVAAAGVAGLVTSDYVKPGALVIDVGTNQVGEGESARLVGDVDHNAVAAVAGALTPVPGGVGPVTTVMLLQSTMTLAEARAALTPAGQADDT